MELKVVTNQLLTVTFKHPFADSVATGESAQVPMSMCYIDLYVLFSFHLLYQINTVDLFHDI